MKTVFTNGCFDVLHVGHVAYLAEAAKLGRLVVWLNSDDGVRLRKGLGRPLQPFAWRKEMLEALRSVAEVRELDDPNMVHVLATEPCDIWCKGGDYHIESINRTEVAAAHGRGIEIVMIPVKYDIHTRNLLCRTK